MRRYNTVLPTPWWVITLPSLCKARNLGSSGLISWDSNTIEIERRRDVGNWILKDLDRNGKRTDTEKNVDFNMNKTDGTIVEAIVLGSHKKKRGQQQDRQRGW